MEATTGPAERRIDAVVFDMDGVVTDTARVHFAAWKLIFDELLGRLAGGEEPTEPFTLDDYLRDVDGKARYDGVASFLAARSIDLPRGHPDDPPERDSVCGVGNRKNAAFRAALRRDGAEAFPSTVALIRRLREAGVATAVISASRNAAEVLDAAGVTDLFEARVDGTVADELGLAGKPDPAVFVEAARRLGVAPERAAVVEDALAGVEAGRRGGFGLVVGVARGSDPQRLRAHGADLVVADLSELDPAELGIGAHPGSERRAGAGR